MNRGAAAISMCLHGLVCVAAWQMKTRAPGSGGGSAEPLTVAIGAFAEPEAAPKPPEVELPELPEPVALGLETLTVKREAETSFVALAPPSPPSPPSPAPPEIRKTSRSTEERKHAGGTARGGSGGQGLAGSAGRGGGQYVPPAYRRSPAPPYPALARDQKREGLVILRVMVSATGGADSVRITRSSGTAALDQAAMQTVRGWLFQPARLDGKPVSAIVEVPVRFRLPRGAV